jgi:hypothetical protein
MVPGAGNDDTSSGINTNAILSKGVVREQVAGGFLLSNA